MAKSRFERGIVPIGKKLDLNLIPVYPESVAKRPNHPRSTLGNALAKLVPDERLRTIILAPIEIRKRRPTFSGNFHMNDYGLQWQETMKIIEAFDDLEIHGPDGLALITSPRNPNLPEVVLRAAYNEASPNIRREVDANVLAGNFFFSSTEADPYARMRAVRRDAQEKYDKHFESQPIAPHRMEMDYRD